MVHLKDKTLLRAGVLLLFLALSCQREPRDVIPGAPDYQVDSVWYRIDRNAPVDLFYICSTETGDYTGPDGAVVHYADASRPSRCPGLLLEMDGADERLSGDLNFYSPYYRQITMESYQDSTVAQKRIQVALEDARRAFQTYQERFNGGRPFVLAGYSQGADIALELLKEMPERIVSRMVATYLLGWKVTRETLEEYPNVRPARGADDVGVTICFNSVHTPADAFHAVSDGNAVAINPVNWHTDAEPAVLADTMTVTLDPATKLLLVEGYPHTDHAFPPYWGGGNYHTFELRWYGSSLRENIRLRSETFLVQKKNGQVLLANP